MRTDGRDDDVPQCAPRTLAIRCANDEALDEVVLHLMTHRIRQAARDAFVLVVQAGSAAPVRVGIKTDGGAESSLLLQTGQVCILDLGAVSIPVPRDEWVMHYHIPSTSLRAFAAYRGMSRLDSLHCHRVYSDPVLHHMSRAMKALLTERPYAVDAVGDSFVRAFYSHLLDNYGRPGIGGTSAAEQLSSRQRRIIEAELATPTGQFPSLGLLAQHCGLSRPRLARAFRNTYGLSLHQHLLNTRVRHAKELLSGSDLALAAIAARVGYANQATFTESFTNAVGIPPGRYRRFRVGGHSQHSAA